MAVFRIEKTRDYTVMSNHHLRDKSLSLKAKGLLSLMLSLPEEWDYLSYSVFHSIDSDRFEYAERNNKRNVHIELCIDCRKGNDPRCHSNKH